LSGAVPGRRIIRAPNHLGDVVAALPAIAADGSDVLIVRWLAPLVALADVAGQVVPLDRGLAGFTRAAMELRQRRYDHGVLLSPAFSAAWLFRWGGVSRLRGTATDGRSLLLRDPVPADRLRGLHRIDAYRLLLGQEVTGRPEARRVRPGKELRDRWRAALGAEDAPLVGLFPGAHAPARRWPVERFEALASELSRRGLSIVVLGGDRERGVTSRVAAATPGAVDIGGRTGLGDLAAVLSLCDLVVTNDTGPMHLAGAVGTPTVSLWGPSDPTEVRQTGSPDARVTGPELPCKPCYRNQCARRGAGTLLADAHEECMRLIDVPGVLSAVEEMLDRRSVGE
jgi:heptosyltransferase-2